MKKILFSILVSSIFTMSVSAGDAFCVGFEEGYKTIKGDMVIVPICPIAPITPIGSTDFREGIKAGMKAANNG